MKARLAKEKHTFNANAIPCNTGCGKTFAANRNKEDLGELAGFGQVSREYMQCPHCGEQYNVGFINAEVEKLIQQNVVLSQVHTKEARAQYRSKKIKGIKLMDRIEAAWRRSLDEGK